MLWNTYLYLYHALSQYTKVDMDFYSSKDDMVNVRDFTHHAFGSAVGLVIRITNTLNDSSIISIPP